MSVRGQAGGLLGDRMDMWRGPASMSLETRSKPARAVAYGSLDLISHRQKVWSISISQVHTRSKVNSALVVFAIWRRVLITISENCFFKTPWGGSVVVQSEVTDTQTLYAHSPRVMVWLCGLFSCWSATPLSHQRGSLFLLFILLNKQHSIE